MDYKRWGIFQESSPQKKALKLFSTTVGLFGNSTCITCTMEDGMCGVNQQCTCYCNHPRIVHNLGLLVAALIAERHRCNGIARIFAYADSAINQCAMHFLSFLVPAVTFRIFCATRAEVVNPTLPNQKALKPGPFKIHPPLTKVTLFRSQPTPTSRPDPYPLSKAINKVKRPIKVVQLPNHKR